MKFMHLYLMEFDVEVPLHVRYNALRIAIRVMLQKESLDFFQDPRGIIPYNIAKMIHDPIGYQLSYIVGHEYAHFVLNHINNGESKSSHNVLGLPHDHDIDAYPRVFSPSQQKEFDADVWSLSNFRFNKNGQEKLIKSILYWFTAISILEQAEEQIFPSPLSKVKTHPLALERIENLADHCDQFKEVWLQNKENTLKTVSSARDFLQDDIALNFGYYEMYGSVYLARPNSEWRGVELFDRKDYY